MMWGAQTLLLLFAIAALAVGLSLLWRRIVLNERAAQASIEMAREARRVECFIRAVEQLADDRLEVRLGAIYGLEQVAAESAAQHWPVVEVLCAFLRSRVGWEPDREQPARLPTDVQAVLTVLGRRNRSREKDERLDLRHTDLRGADLNGLHLSRADLYEAHLEGASLKGAHLAAADLRRAHLTHADLVEADLRGADLREANLESAYLVEAHLEGADLGGAYLGGACLGGAHLEGADLGGAHLDGAYMYKVHLGGASLEGARVVTAIGIHRDQRKRINSTAAVQEEAAVVQHAGAVSLRRNPMAKPVSLRRRRARKQPQHPRSAALKPRL